MDWKKITAPLATLVGAGLVGGGAFGLTAASYSGVGVASSYGVTQALGGLFGLAVLVLREWKLGGTAPKPVADLSIRVGDKEIKFNLAGQDQNPRLPEAIADIVNTMLAPGAIVPTEGTDVSLDPVPVPRGRRS